MNLSRLLFVPIATASLSLLVITGCGGSADSGQQAGATPAPEKTASTKTEKRSPGSRPLPTVAIAAPADSDDDLAEPKSDDSADVKVQIPAAGTPQRHLFDITQLRLKPYVETDDVEKLREERKKRNQQIVDLATMTLAKTHKDPELEPIFTLAVHRLVEARLQLALQGDDESIAALYENAESLYKRDPKSKAAIEAAYTLAQFAHTNAARSTTQKTQWLIEFSRQARLFASNFPEEQSRGASLLFSAGRSCDLNDLSDEAIACYAVSQKTFPESPHATSIVASLRRLNLNGKPLQFAGPTIDGGQVSIEDYRGKVVLIVFWSTSAKPFVDQLPLLMSLSQKYAPHGLSVLAVNLDEEEPNIDAFLEQHAITWPQIFYSDRARRGWNNPIAAYYAVRSVPTLWLVGADGNVANTNVRASALEAEIRNLIKESRSTRKGPQG